MVNTYRIQLCDEQITLIELLYVNMMSFFVFYYSDFMAVSQLQATGFRLQL